MEELAQNNLNATNYIWESRLAKVKPLLDKTDILGYVAARNYKAIDDAVEPYIEIKNKLIRKYGKDSESNPGQYAISINAPEFKQFSDELDETGGLEVSVQVYTLPYESIIGKMSGQEILDLDWMLRE